MGNPDSEATGPNICAHAHSTAIVVRVAINWGDAAQKRCTASPCRLKAVHLIRTMPRGFVLDGLSSITPLEELVRANRASHRSSSTQGPIKEVVLNGRTSTADRTLVYSTHAPRIQAASNVPN